MSLLELRVRGAALAGGHHPGAFPAVLPSLQAAAPRWMVHQHTLFVLALCPRYISATNNAALPTFLTCWTGQPGRAETMLSCP